MYTKSQMLTSGSLIVY